MCLERGERARAEGIPEELSQLAERTHDARVILFSFTDLGMSEVPDGRLEGAVSTADRLLEKAEELGSPVQGRVFAS